MYRVTVAFIATEHGGKKCYVKSGYRASVAVKSDKLKDIELHLKEPAIPGTAIEGDVTFLVDDYIPTENEVCIILEGKRTVGILIFE